MGVGPGDIRRYLFIMVTKIPLLPRTTGLTILDIIVPDGYILGQAIYKVLLSRQDSQSTYGAPGGMFGLRTGVVRKGPTCLTR